jgi:hypothetical protein
MFCARLREYEFHPDAKSADARGKPSGKQTVGLLRLRHVRVERIIYIGRESNRMEEIEAGVIHSPESVYTEYPDPERRVADQNSACTAKLPDRNPKEVQREIPFDALASDGRAESASAKEPRIAEIDAPETWWVFR